MLLDVGESYVDPENPCEPYVCKVSADAQEISRVLRRVSSILLHIH